MRDSAITEAMHHMWWLQLKRAIKLCDNDLAPKQGQLGYDYDWKSLIHKVNSVTYSEDLDQSGDKTTVGKH